MAAQLLRLGRQEESLDVINQLLAANPGDIEARNNRGNLLRELKRFDAALTDYDAVLAARPDLAETWTNRGAVLSEMGRPAEALESLDRALALEAGSARGAEQSAALPPCASCRALTRRWKIWIGRFDSNPALPPPMPIAARC